MVRVLVIDDDPTLHNLLSLTLAREGFEVISALSGLEGLRQAYRCRPNLIILDVIMPEMDGWETLKRIRQMSDVPVIMLTARSDSEDTIQGLTSGADDYIAKPFDLDELLARMQAVLRRTAPELLQDELVYRDDGNLKINLATMRVERRGEPVNLTPTEFHLLEVLVRAGEAPVDRRELLTAVWGEPYRDDFNILRVHIRHLREKIEDDPNDPHYIVTVRGVGYRFQMHDS
ncbi:MAG: DNA-binding response regulator [Chloroflexi bacterium]|nr:MAG: DNA-binding response regulator [Chloroflexota bacterium]